MTGDFTEEELRLSDGEVGGYLEMKEGNVRMEWGYEESYGESIVGSER